MDRAGPELLARLLDEHAPALALYARQWCDSPDDVVQEALLELVRQPKLPGNVVAWLYRVVRNRAISQRRGTLRRRDRERVAAERLSAWFAEDSSAADAESAAEALMELPLEEREVIIAHTWGGLTFADIAEAVGVSVSTTYRRYESGLEKLRKKLGVPCLKNR
jgi:RNA polymerase sigma-70 factor (ECF subfamily)